MTEQDLETYRTLADALIEARMWAYQHPTAPRVVRFTAPAISLYWTPDLVKACGLDVVNYLRPTRPAYGEQTPLPIEAREKVCIVDGPQHFAGLAQFLAVPGELVVLLCQDSHANLVDGVDLQALPRRHFPAGLLTLDEMWSRVEKI
jgi:hypothetical protein